MCSELEDNTKKHNIRAAFQTVKNLTEPFKPRTEAIKDSAAKKLTDPGQVNHRWKEYCEEP